MVFPNYMSSQFKYPNADHLSQTVKKSGFCGDSESCQVDKCKLSITIGKQICLLQLSGYKQ